MVGLAPHLPEGLLGEVLAAARGIGEEGARAEVLAGLAPYLPEGLLEEAVVAARGIRNEPARAWALAGLAPHLPEGLRVPVLEEAGAAARGIVAYSGDEVPGFGNMVLMVHPGGWVTLYAHNSVNFVVAGEQVPAGAVLAELGSTGISRGPHVHFELIYDGKNCDPVTLFRPGVRHRSRLADIPRQTWTRPTEPPEDLKCFRRRRHPRSRWVVNE